jgi:hypothetical protein
MAGHRLGETADLPGDLVDGDAVLDPSARVGGHAETMVVDDEGVVVVGIAEEVPVQIAERPVFLRMVGRVLGADVGELEAEQILVESQPFAHPEHVDAEVTEPANLERPFEKNAADVASILWRRQWRRTPLPRGATDWNRAPA